jgi:hypothetical protein
VCYNTINLCNIYYISYILGKRVALNSMKQFGNNQGPPFWIAALVSATVFCKNIFNTVNWFIIYVGISIILYSPITMFPYCLIVWKVCGNVVAGLVALICSMSACASVWRSFCTKHSSRKRSSNSVMNRFFKLQLLTILWSLLCLCSSLWQMNNGFLFKPARAVS